MQTTLKQTNIKLSDDEQRFVIEKISSLDKFYPKMQEAHIEIEQDMHHRKGNVYRCEVNLTVPGQLIRVEKEAESLSKAVNKVKDHLKVILSRARKKMLNKRNK